MRIKNLRFPKLNEEESLGSGQALVPVPWWKDVLMVVAYTLAMIFLVEVLSDEPHYDYPPHNCKAGDYECIKEFYNEHDWGATHRVDIP